MTVGKDVSECGAPGGGSHAWTDNVTHRLDTRVPKELQIIVWSTLCQDTDSFFANDVGMLSLPNEN